MAINNQTFQTFIQWAKLLRWNKPSGRLILLIPAGWALWLTPSSPPESSLILLIISGGLLVSGAGCIVNDIWDRRIDRQVVRTMNRPLVKGSVRISTAWILLCLTLLLSFLVAISIPTPGRNTCLALSILALPPILIYPSAKRWLPYPQALLAICWGFAVLIPWAASEGSLNGGLPLLCSWLATLSWTFGFDTIYAMSDRQDDAKLGLNSSAITLGENALIIVSFSYALTCLLLGIAAIKALIGIIFWPFWLIATLGMQYQIWILRNANNSTSFYGKHFQNQVKLGSLLLLGLIIGRII